MKKLLMFLSAFFSVSLISAIAFATPVDVTYVGYGPYRTTNVTFNGTTTNNVVAGYYNIRINGIDEIYTNDTFKSFCLDLFDNAPAKNTTQSYNLVSIDKVPDKLSGGMGLDKANLLYGLWGMYRVDFNDTEAASFQIAVWQIIFGDGLTINSLGSSFKVSSTYNAQSLLDELNPNQRYYAGIAAVTSDRYQDFVVPVSVPEPAAVLFFGTCLVGLVIFQRKRLVEIKS